MLKVCVIGMGPIGNRHADMYQCSPLAKLVGVCDIIKTRADAAAARLGVPAYYDAQEMLAALHPDLCSITTPAKKMAATTLYRPCRPRSRLPRVV